MAATIDVPKLPQPFKLTRDQFEFMLAGVESNYALAFESAKGLSVFDTDARGIARQRRMNEMVENGIIQIEEMTNVTVAATYNQMIGKIPFPPRIDHCLTMLNFENQR